MIDHPDADEAQRSHRWAGAAQVVTNLRETVLSNIARPGVSPGGDPYHSSAAEQAIARARQARDEAALARARLPRHRDAWLRLRDARSGTAGLSQLQQYLPEELDGSSNPLIRQAQLAIAAYRAGVCVAVNMVLGGFDTHSHHDSNHIPRLTQLLEGIDFLMEEATRHGVHDRIVVVIGSDLGRAPTYNAGNGKDHWTTTSMMLMGAGISGNRVIGATDERLQHRHRIPA